MREFNTAGACDPGKHYMLPPGPRLPDARRLIEGGQYFVLHAPRQSGKTTTLRALARALTAEGKHAALRFSCEAGAASGDDFAGAERIILARLASQAGEELPPHLCPPRPWPAAPAGQQLAEGLKAWAEACPLPLVLFLDEIDALRGQALQSVLRQLRDGHSSRPHAFPHSVVLCGLRDVRDYKSASGGDATRLGTSSPFNIKVASLTLENFTLPEVRSLYLQHTHETGQKWTKQAIVQAHDLTGGQPWLVNALAREIVDELRHQGTISSREIDRAKERLILQRQTHLDSLVARLLEPRVQRVILPLMKGEFALEGTYNDDVSYVRDLGLVARDAPLRVSNPIYREVIVRVLSDAFQDNLVLDRPAFIRPDGRLDMRKLLDEFLAFWREHGESLGERTAYHEVAPQLVLMAFLQRVVNGGGFVDREYGVGMGRIDLLVRWPLGGRRWQREALELKVWRPKKKDPLEQGLTQIEQYLDGLGLHTGTLVLFDRRPEALPVEDRSHRSHAITPKGYRVRLLRA
jgi:hypothetical protein